MNKKEFYEKFWPVAKKTKDPTFALAQWSWETGFASNRTWTYNNLAGIKYVGQSYASGKSASPGYAKYDDLDDFVKDYNRVMGLSYYEKIWKALKSGNRERAIEELNASPYSEADYNIDVMLDRMNEIDNIVANDPGSNLVSVDKLNDLDLETEIDKMIKNKGLVQMASVGAAALIIAGLFSD